MATAATAATRAILNNILTATRRDGVGRGGAGGSVSSEHAAWCWCAGAPVRARRTRCMRGARGRPPGLVTAATTVAGGGGGGGRLPHPHTAETTREMGGWGSLSLVGQPPPPLRAAGRAGWSHPAAARCRCGGCEGHAHAGRSSGGRWDRRSQQRRQVAVSIPCSGWFPVGPGFARNNRRSLRADKIRSGGLSKMPNRSQTNLKNALSLV